MNSTPPGAPEPPKLPWSFWLVAFAPALAAVLADVFVASQKLRGMDYLNLLLGAGAICGLIANLITSPLAGLRYAKWHKPTTWRVGHVVLYALMFFVLNLLLLPAGCSVAGLSTKVFW